MIRTRIITPLLVSLLVAATQPAWSLEPNELGTRASWRVPRAEDTRQLVSNWLTALPLEQQAGEELLAMWEDVEDATPEILLDRFK